MSKPRHFVPFHTLISIYNSLIAPYLHYGLVAWGHARETQLSKLLILQKRALHFMHFADRRDHTIPFFLNAKILPLNCVNYKLLAEMMHDVSNGCVHVPPNLKDLFLRTKKVHSYSTRSSVSDNFYIQRSRLEIKRQLFSRAGVKLWNGLPTKLRVLPKTMFKKKIQIILFNMILESEDLYDDFESLVTKVKSQLS